MFSDVKPGYTEGIQLIKVVHSSALCQFPDNTFSLDMPIYSILITGMGLDKWCPQCKRHGVKSPTFKVDEFLMIGVICWSELL